jgi:hypothetical protein
MSNDRRNSEEGRRSSRRRTGALAVLVMAAFGLPSAASAAVITLTPTYFATYVDAVTGDNCNGMAPGGNCSGLNAGWHVDPGADNYFQDLYERPTVQTFTNIGGLPKSNEYYGYLDITGARYGYDSSFMYFQTTVFSEYAYKNDGSVDTGQFGSGTRYGVQIENTLLLRGEQNKDTIQASPGAFDSLKAQGFCDSNDDVPGPGGIGTPNEGGNGYDLQVIQTDGYLSGGPTVLYLRSFRNANGSVSVELAFNYALYNASSVNSACRPINPASLSALVFETARGLTDNSNYLWNDRYSQAEAGSPYATGAQNIYQVDNLRTAFQVTQVPEPFSLLLFGVGLAAIARFRSTR